MATDLSRGLAKSMHPADYWALEGGHLPELQFVAMRVLSKPVGIPGQDIERHAGLALTNSNLKFE